MTVKQNQTMPYEEVIPWVRDELSSMAGWTVISDSTGGAATWSQGDYIAFETGTGEDLKLRKDPNNIYNNGQALSVEYGPDYDATNDTWNDRYSKDPAQVMNSNQSTVAYSTSEFSQPNDTHRVWLHYDDGLGFYLFVQRDVDDGNDGVLEFSMAEINKTWDYTAASARESKYAWRAYGETYVGNRIDVPYAVAEGGECQNYNPARGRPNGDADYNNFPLVAENVITSQQYSGTIIGTHNLWMEPDAGTDGDTVQDGSGNVRYHLYQRESSPLRGVKVP